MNTNESIRNDTSEDIIELGVASVETKGDPGIGEGVGTFAFLGISED